MAGTAAVHECLAPEALRYCNFDDIIHLLSNSVSSVTQQGSHDLNIYSMTTLIKSTIL